MKMNDIVNESAEMTAQQRQLARLGQLLMDRAPQEKDDGLSNIMAAVGNELTNFGTAFGPRNLNDLVRKTGATAEVIRKLLEYAEKLATANANLKKDHEDGGLDDTNDTDDDFDAPDDEELARQADAAARAKRK